MPSQAASPRPVLSPRNLGPHVKDEAFGSAASEVVSHMRKEFGKSLHACDLCPLMLSPTVGTRFKVEEPIIDTHGNKLEPGHTYEVVHILFGGMTSHVTRISKVVNGKKS